MLLSVVSKDDALRKLAPDCADRADWLDQVLPRGLWPAMPTVRLVSCSLSWRPGSRIDPSLLNKELSRKMERTIVI